MLDVESRSVIAGFAQAGQVYEIPVQARRGSFHQVFSLVALALVALLGIGCLALVLIDGRIAGLAGLLLLPLYALAVRWRRLAQRLTTRGALSELLQGSGPFFLYLRPFAADRDAPTNAEVFDRLLAPERRDGIEEDLARSLGRTGPLVALGRPGETVPLLGARRFYVAAAPGDPERETRTWKTSITVLAAQARLVILRPGVSPGVHWEYLLCATRVPRNRLIVRIGPDDWEGYYGLARFLRERLGLELPRHPGEYVAFGDDATPVTGDLLGNLLRRSDASGDQPPLAQRPGDLPP